MADQRANPWADLLAAAHCEPAVRQGWFAMLAEVCLARGLSVSPEVLAALNG